MSRVLLSPPDVGELEIEYVTAAMRSGWIAPAGPDLTAFEAEMAARCGVPHAVGLASGTAALHLGLLVLGVQPGDAVICPTMTFAATANAVVYTGAVPVFVDCEPDTGNVDPELVAEAVERQRAAGRRVGAIVPVDLLGKVADVERLEAVSRATGVPLLWDAAESVGATCNGRPAGSAGRAAALSFNGNKIMTTSGGGMFVTADAGLADRVRYLSTQARQPVRHYEHTDIGYNYRLSNLLAALGRAQLQRLDEMMKRRRAIRERYREAVAGTGTVTVFGGADDASDNCWLTSVVVEGGTRTAADLIDTLDAADVESRPIWKPMHLQPVFAGAEAVVNGTSEHLFEHAVTLPSGSAMSAEDVDRVCDHLHAFARERRG